MKMSWSPKLNKRYIFNSIILVLALLIGALVYFHFHNKNNSNSVPNSVLNDGISHQELSISQHNNANQFVDQKNYQQAEYSYITSASEASTGGNNQQAVKILQEAISKISDQYITWDLYDGLAIYAKSLNNHSLEISSLKKALNKAQQPNSGTPQFVITKYQNELKSLGSSQ